MGGCRTIALLMRVLVGLGVATAVLVASLPADARPQRRATHKANKKRAARISTIRERDHVETRELARGQSIGAPWEGRLQHAAQLPPGDSYHIRRPARSFGTETTIEFIERAIDNTFEAYP